MEKYYLGVDIGGTKCAILLGLYEAQFIQIIERVTFPTEPKRGFEDAIERIYQAIDALLVKHQDKASEIAAIGISCGGPLNSKTGIILSPPNLYGWDNIPIVELMERRYHLKTFLQNDANACALAEWRFGASQGSKNNIFLTFGTGMGAGLILEGRLYDGTTGMAGEVGHLRLASHGPVGFGKEGSFEGFCSGGGIAQIARAKVIAKLQAGERPAICKDFSQLDLLTAKSVAEAADNGDLLALSIYDECAAYLGQGLSMLIDILNPEVIVLGSIYARSENLLAAGAMKIIQKESIAASVACCRVVPAALGDYLGDYACLSVAMQD